MPKAVSVDLKHQTDAVTLSIIDAKNNSFPAETVIRLDKQTRDRNPDNAIHGSGAQGRAGKKREMLVLDIPLQPESNMSPPLPNAVDAKGRPFVSVNRPVKRADHESRSNDMSRELTHARWTPVLVDGDAFAASDAYRLRPTLFAKPRPIQMLVSVCLSNPEHLFSIFENIPAAFEALDRAVASNPESQGKGPFGDERWKHRILHIHCLMYPQGNLALHLHDLGVRPLMDREEIRGFELFSISLQHNQRDPWSIYEV